MKAIYPYLGNFILPKTEINKIVEKYDKNSKNNFELNSCILENNIFNYFKDNTFFIFNQITRASVSQLKSALGIKNKPDTQSNSKNSETKKEFSKITDNDIMTNSFFTTLKIL